MKHSEKKKKCSIRWVFFAYCLLLVIIMLAVVWTMRLVFVGSTYQQVRTAIADRTARELAKVIDDGRNFKDVASGISSNSDTTIFLIDGSGNIVHSSNGEYTSYIPTAKELYDIRNTTLAKDNGKYFEERETNDDKSNKVLIYSVSIKLGNQVAGIGPVKEGTGNIIITCRTEPMAATIKTINFELLIITVIMIIFALIISYLLARHVSKPIIEINDQSSKLAKGDYSVKFTESGCREIGELGKTLNHTAQELGRTDRMRRDLIANVSHDLRTPLTMIRGYVEMMRDIPNENNEENMEVILKETDYLAALVKDMLDISKIEANAVKFTLTDFDLNELLVEIANRYNSMYKMQEFTFNYKPLDYQLIVNSDKVMLTNIIYNLINNAINHIGEDKNVDIRLEFVGKRVRVHIVDKGEGIEESKIDGIWDRYYKAERNLKRESVGSGLGLSIVKTVITKLGGDCGVRSRLGEGSDFYIEIDINQDN